MTRRGNQRGGWEESGFGVRLRVLRLSTGLTQDQLAERAGISQSTVAKLETGKQEPAWPLVRLLARALGVPCQDFEPRAGERLPPPLPPGRKPPPRGRKP